MKALPIHSVDLVSELNASYPSKPPDINDSERMVWFKAGQRAVVETLLLRAKSSEDDELPRVL